jgi:hypothetical protein
VAAVPIVHPYGTVGDLKSVPFGGDEHRDMPYFALAKEIKTYTEQLADYDENLNRMRMLMRRAKCLVFLGFAFGEQNMKILAPETQFDRKPIFGTAYGLSESDSNVVSAQLMNFFIDAHRDIAQRMNLIQLDRNLKCSQLFDNYARSLSAA